MKKNLPFYLRSVLLAGIISLTSISSYASHVIGAELRYKWVSGLTYEITLALYGDCGTSSFGSFRTLPAATPQICIYNGATLVGNINLSQPVPVCGTEITPVCADSLSYTNCTDLSYSIQGVKKFVCTGTYTLPTTSAVWRFVYTANNGGTSHTYSCPGTTIGTFTSSPATSGRTSSITNLSSPGSTSMQLIDTLNNSATNSRGHNSSPILTVEPTPYFCQGYLDCYNPGAIDIYDTNYLYYPAGDSLVFSLVPPTNGTGGCGSVGGAVGYSALQYPGGPVNTGDHPLYCVDGSPSSFVFDPLTGQLCFKPLAQRSTVVYNIREYHDDTVLGVISHVLIGTMQREMNFLVKPCTYTTPEGKIDSALGTATMIDSTHYYTCANSGILTLVMNPREPSDPTLNITVTATGLAPGFLFTVTGNGTPTPRVTIDINTGTIAPGNYSFYLTYTDNHCPLTGTVTQAFKVDILPVPTVRDSLIKLATCTDSAVFMIIPGGTGKPWTIKISNNIGDTIQIFAADSVSFLDSLPPGRYNMTIFTAVSNQCSVNVPLIIDTPHFTITGIFTDPTYCGANDGKIVINGLTPGKMDTVRWDFQGIAQPPRGFIVTPSGTDTMTGLLAGTHSNIRVYEGLCVTNPISLTLTNPPFTYRTVTSVNPSKCGFCDGIIKLWGIHPGQLDTISYTFNGVTTTSLSNFIASDSTVTISGLCVGTYTNFVVKTAGVCTYTIPGPIVLSAPPIVPLFDTVMHLGCQADTVQFINQSTPATDLTYQWFFGDGTTSTAINPLHVYTNTTANTVTIKLIITNTKCVDSFKITKTFDNYAHAGFTFVPDPIVCQGSTVTFTNTSTVSNPTYLWSFGDGTTDVSFSPTHIYTNTGQYKIKLVATDHLPYTPIPPSTFVPCYDTMSKTISVDSISTVTLITTDSILCRGQGITFNGIFSSIGDTGLIWSFGDGTNTFNVNPIIHAFDGDGTFDVNVTVKYRACPEATASRQVRVYGYPSIYLGPDQAMCPGGNAITLVDDRNEFSPKARWQWNTGETTPSIIVKQPGLYSAVVTIDGCSSADTVWVQKDCYISVPNVFTPNGDGTNDYFFPRQMLTRGVTKFTMNVYNRWGQTVYETTSVDGRGWDGAFNGKQQPEGVYVYMIDVVFKDGQIEHHQGNVTLMR
jgi:gliding motility-associated-like protein